MSCQLTYDPICYLEMIVWAERSSMKSPITQGSYLVHGTQSLESKGFCLQPNLKGFIPLSLLGSTSISYEKFAVLNSFRPFSIFVCFIKVIMNQYVQTNHQMYGQNIKNIFASSSLISPWHNVKEYLNVIILYFQLHCCGVENYTDWQSWPYGKTGNVSRGCCKEDDSSNTCFMGKNTLPEDVAAKSIYTEGCYQAIKDDLKEEVVALCVVLFIMVIVQVSAWLVGFAWIQMHHSFGLHIRKNYSGK